MTPTGNAVSWRALRWWGAGFGALLLALYTDILIHLVEQWWDEAEYSHGFLVPVVSGYLVWQRRAQLAALVPRGTWWGLPIVLGGISGLVLGDLGAELFLSRSSLLAILAGLVLLHLGPAIFRVVAFPLAFLLFMVPLPAILYYAITFPLQGFAAGCAAGALDALRIPVLLEGNIIHLSHLSLGVAEACSGIRSLISLFCLATGWAYLTLSGVWPRLLMVVSALPIAIAANVGRVVATALVAEWADPAYAEGFYHEFSGWLAFAFAFVCLALLQRVLERRDVR